VSLTLPGLGTRTKHETGKVCEVGPTGVNVPPYVDRDVHDLRPDRRVLEQDRLRDCELLAAARPTTALGGAVTGRERFDALTIHI
jgi:hypothetical protein